MTLLDLAMRYVGEIKERPGNMDHPFILWCLEATPLAGPQHDEIPWCSAFMSRLAWELRLPRSKRANARSWLDVGISLELEQATPGYVVAIFKRGTNPAQGHVGAFAGVTWANEDENPAMLQHMIRVVGGNQGNGVGVGLYPVQDLIGLRSLA